MQWPPPRPRPSSWPAMASTSMPDFASRAFARHQCPDDQAGSVGGEHVLRQDADGASRPPLALADQDDAVRDRHDVAALDRRAAPIVVEAAVPDPKVGSPKTRMEPVDGLE